MELSTAYDPARQSQVAAGAGAGAEPRAGGDYRASTAVRPPPAACYRHPWGRTMSERSHCAEIVLAALLAGCTAGGAQSPDGGATGADAEELACAGDAPAIGSCFRGDFFADCGGGAPPRFGCGPAGPYLLDCLWFVGGCVAAGYTPSPCPADELCCMDEWPYSTPGEPHGLDTYLYRFGQRPWDRDRAMAVAVAVDPSLLPAATTWTCSGVDPNPGGPNNPCNGFRGSPEGRLVDTVVLLAPNGGVGGWYPWIEVDPTRTGGPAARVCGQPYTDVVGTPTCPRHADIACATTGVLTLGRIPTTEVELAGLSARVDVGFDGGFRLEGAFTLP